MSPSSLPTIVSGLRTRFGHLSRAVTGDCYNALRRGRRFNPPAPLLSKRMASAVTSISAFRQVGFSMSVSAQGGSLPRFTLSAERVAASRCGLSSVSGQGQFFLTENTAVGVARLCVVLKDLPCPGPHAASIYLS